MGRSAPGKDLLQRLETSLAPPALAAIQAAREVCARNGAFLYLVGGTVRDLVLGRENLDLDLAIESPVAPVAEALAAGIGGRCVLHSRFGTASVSGPGFRLDLAQTRRETYARPGALPDVQPGSLHDDLVRRDFTVNALALRLTKPAGELIDIFDGRRDIEARLFRVLHERSFQDDATRMLRAARYAARLGFALDARTEGWLQRDLRFLDAVSGPRLRRELVFIFEEPAAADAAELAQRLGVLRAVHPALELTPGVADRWRGALAGAQAAPRDELGFCVLAGAADEPEIVSLTARLHLQGRFERALRDLVRLRRLSDKLAARSPVELVEALDGFVPAAVRAASIIEGGAAAAALDAYLGRLRQVRPILRGNDLVALGIEPGVAVGEALRALRNARLEGRVSSRTDEIDLVRGRVKKD